MYCHKFQIYKHPFQGLLFRIMQQGQKKQLLKERKLIHVHNNVAGHWGKIKCVFYFDYRTVLFVQIGQDPILRHYEEKNMYILVKLVTEIGHCVQSSPASI